MSIISHRTAYRTALGLAIATGLLLAWLSLGVGVIGKDGDPANRIYFGVLVVGIVGAAWARFRAPGLARAMFATALATALVGAIAVILGLGYPYSPRLELIGLHAMFVALFTGSALLFRRAARLA